MDLKDLQSVVDNLDQLVIKLEDMGFDPAIFDDFPAMVESIKLAGIDAREFKKTALLVTIGASAAAFAIAAHLVIGYAIEAKIAKIERNQTALELLEKVKVNLRVDPKIDRKTGTPILAISSGNRLILGNDGKTVYIVLKP